MEPSQEHLFRAAILFAEADKSSVDNFMKDATGIYAVANNRTNNKNRWGYDSVDQAFTDSWVRDDGVEIKQFTGYGSAEFNKIMQGQMTPEEEEYFKAALQIIKGYDSGLIEDPTGGADHYYNDSIASPKWGSLTEEKMVKEGENYYPETYRTSGHTYRKETQRWSAQRKKVSETQKLLKGKGFYEGEIDGIAGPIMKRGVQEFQKQSGLTADGIAGKKTMAALGG